MSEEAKAPARAKEGHVLVVLCKSGCGELKRRSHRTDALFFQREHLKEHAKHEVEITERVAEAKPAAAPKKSKPAVKSKKAAKAKGAAKRAKAGGEEKAA